MLITLNRGDIMKLKKTAAFLSSAVMALCSFALTGCEDKPSQDSSSDDVSIKNSTNAVTGKVELKEYSFPEFLTELDDSTPYYSTVFSSFDASRLIEKVDNQPYQGYDCKSLIDDTLYMFVGDSGQEGLLDKNGDVVLEASAYSRIVLAGERVLALYENGDSGEPSKFVKYDSHGSLTDYDPPEFDKDKILISDAYSADPDKAGAVFKAVYLPDGGSVGIDDESFMLFDSAEWADKDAYAGIDDCKAAIKADLDGKHYLICFDELYNYTVCETAYAAVRLKVGDVYGECTVNRYEDYFELVNMIDSFGLASGQSSPSKDHSLDFIQIETGLGTAEHKQYTFSPDGYCLTDVLTADGEKPVDKYFSYLDKEDFVDLVLWVDQVLSQEYEGKTAKKE